MQSLLDNIIWPTLIGPHAKYAIGTDSARRYAPGFSPIVGFENPTDPDFAALTPYCTPGEHFYCGVWAGVAPADWSIESESTMFQMIGDNILSGIKEDPEAVRLGPEHAAQALALATLTRPGPFGPRTTELGEFFGYFEGPRLVAMAGERMHAGLLREISGVCTHPDFQGRGMARRLIATLIARQVQRGETPFIHVMRDNVDAHRFYERMGFRDYRETIVRVISLR